MIVYSSTKKGFCHDVLTATIDRKILSYFIRETGHSTGKSEMLSWRNSMMYMDKIISDPEIPDSAGVAIEYKIPQTSKRIDFILTGVGDDQKKNAILIELKQWSKAQHSGMDGVLKTFVANDIREVSHPSYQVWSYAALLEDYNSNVQDLDIGIIPCAYLHNYEPDDVITNDFYNYYLEKAPVFLRHDAIKLQNFIKKHVKYGDDKSVLFSIEHGKIRPSKSLSDNLGSLLKGNNEFILIDDQKIVFEKAKQLALLSNEENKNVLIIEGGPGTGKSIVAIHLLNDFTKNQMVSQYVTRNSAPREVYQYKLTGSFSKTRISNLFSSSGSFTDIEDNTFDALIIDEAHRLNEKSGMFGNIGENQVKELIKASKCALFFIDENQQVTVKDIGSKAEIYKWAKILGASIHEASLSSQFRCSGSDGYIAWINNSLQIKDTANEKFQDLEYDFKVIDSPIELHNMIIELNKLNNKARMVAGYCWKWSNKQNGIIKDIVIGDYAAAWNLLSHGQAWLVHPESVTEVGCIHTCQGLDLEYVGVIIGPDLIVRNGNVITDVTKRASTDQSVKGMRKMLEDNYQKASQLADKIIKNTYRTLLTRGMKGCYVYCTDDETQEYFKNLLNSKRSIYFSNNNGASILA